MWVTQENTWLTATFGIEGLHRAVNSMYASQAKHISESNIQLQSKMAAKQLNSVWENANIKFFASTALKPAENIDLYICMQVSNTWMASMFLEWTTMMTVCSVEWGISLKKLLIAENIILATAPHGYPKRPDPRVGKAILLCCSHEASSRQWCITKLKSWRRVGKVSFWT